MRFSAAHYSHATIMSYDQQRAFIRTALYTAGEKMFPGNGPMGGSLLRRLKKNAQNTAKRG
jgi:hypothetical protein